MSETLPISLQRIRFAEAADDYLRMLRTQHPEHFMEGVAQAKQRKITVESLDLVCAERSDVHAYNELLVQFRRKKDGSIGQVVPDNMVVVCPDEPDVDGSYDVPFQPVGPFWVLEYISKNNKRKDYEDSFNKYEKELKVPYYLTFYPDNQEMTLYRHNRRRYVSVKPNAVGRYAIPELELELALLDGWVRFWFRGKLLALPPELQRDLDKLREQNQDLQRRLGEETQRANLAELQMAAMQAELARLQKELGEK